MFPSFLKILKSDVFSMLLACIRGQCFLILGLVLVTASSDLVYTKSIVDWFIWFTFYAFHQGRAFIFLISLSLFNSWDEWVGIDRLMKHTEENVQKQQELRKKQGTDKNGKAARGSQMKTKGSTG